MPAVSLISWTRAVDKQIRAHRGRNLPPGGASYVGTDLALLGVRAADIRALARDFDQDLPAPWRDCAQALWQSPLFDVRSLAIELAVRRRKEFLKNDWTLFKKWLDVSVGWAMIDHITCDPMADLLDRFPDLAVKTVPWSKSRNLWLRRASLAVFCRPALKGKFLEISLDNLERLAADPEPMVYKAVSWLLRNHIKSNRTAVERFLRDHEQVLAKQVLREVRAKLVTGKKNPNR